MSHYYNVNALAALLFCLQLSSSLPTKKTLAGVLQTISISALAKQSIRCSGLEMASWLCSSQVRFGLCFEKKLLSIIPECFIL
jgi:hypothetical protein